MRKKTKRLLSLLTAAAISVSAFAGWTIQAGAADTPIADVGDDFESYDISTEEAPWEPTKWTKSGSQVFTVENDSTLNSKVLKATAGGTGQRNATLKFSSAVSQTNDPIKVEYKWNSTTVGANCNTVVSLVDTNGKEIVGLQETAANAILLNSTTNTNLQRGWYTVSAVIDFETKMVLDFTLTANGSEQASVTYKNVPFVSNEAVDVAGFAITGNRASGTTLTTTVLLDDVTLYTTDDYFKATITVTDKTNAAVAGATVVIDGTTYTTDVQGKVVVKLSKEGSHTYTISKTGYNSTGDESGTPEVTGSITSDAADINAKLSEVPYTPEVTAATISGGQKVIYAPTGDTAATSTAYTVAVTDQNERPMTEGYTTEWAVYEKGTQTAVTGVTAPEGVVTVTKDFTAGADKDALECDVVATVTDSVASSKTVKATGSIIITNSDILHYATEDYTATAKSDALSHNIDEVTIPDTGITIKFDWNKGSYDSSKADRYNMLTFKSDDATIFDMKDMNAGLTLNAGSSSLNLGTTERNKPYPTVITILGKLLIISFNGGENQVIELDEAPTKITSLVSGSNQDNGGGGGALGMVISSKIAVDTNGVRIGGKTQVAKITGKTVTKDYTATAYVPLAGETFTWTVTKKDGSVAADMTIADGKLSIGSAAEAGEYTIKAQVSEEKAGTLDITVAEAVPEFEITGPATLDISTESQEYSVDKVTDQFGDDITEYVTPTWSLGGQTAAADPKVTFTVDDSEAGDAVLIKATYNGDKLDDVEFENVTLTAGTYEATAPAGTKVMLWNKLDGDGAMKPVDEAKTVQAAAGGDDNTLSADGVLTVKKAGTAAVEATILGKKVTKNVTIAKYSKTVENHQSGDVDVSDLINYGATTYTVTDASGATEVLTATDSKITPTKTGKIEIVPNYKFDLGGQNTAGYTNVNAVKANGYGFTSAPTVTDGTGTGIQSKGVNLDTNAFEVDVPDGRYDMTFYKSDTTRTYIRVNGYQIVPEANYQDGDSETQAPGIYTKKDVVVTGGVATVTTGWNYGVAPISAVEITKKSDMEGRKTHIWLAGDSTVTNYRPTPSSRDDWGPGKRRTGWGQLFEYYLGDSVIVDNYAHSGDWSTNWYANTFPSVMANAEEGDYLLIQFGINDRADKNNCPQDVMNACLTSMVKEAREKGVIPVLMTPEICISQYGSVGEHEQSTGSGNAGWFNQSKLVAEAQDVLLIDLADLSGKLWATMGRTWVDANYFLEADDQHMSYQGAKLVASLVATNILDQKAEGKTTQSGESFANIPVNAKVEANITYTDASDGQERTIKRQAAEFKLPN